MPGEGVPGEGVPGEGVPGEGVCLSRVCAWLGCVHGEHVNTNFMFFDYLYGRL